MYVWTNVQCTLIVHQKVYPALPDPRQKPPFSWPITTCCPRMAATWAAVGATPGGGGGMEGGAWALNREQERLVSVFRDIFVVT